MSCGVGLKRGLDLVLWHRLAAQIRLLAWKLPYAVGAALKRPIHHVNIKKKKKEESRIYFSVLPHVLPLFSPMFSPHNNYSEFCIYNSFALSVEVPTVVH